MTVTEITTPAPWIRFDLAPQIYRAIPAESPSSIKHALTSAKAFRAAKDEPFEESDEMRLGSAAHCCVFEPDELPLRFVVWDEGRRYGKTWDAFCEANANRTILTAGQYETAIKLRDSVQANPAVRAILKRSGQREVSLRWDKPIGGHVLALKGRPDLVADRIYDLKTAWSIDESRLYWRCRELGYLLQQSAYQQGYAAATGETLQSVLIFVETRPPFDVVVKTLEADAMEVGRHQWETACEVVARGQQTGIWPGLSDIESPLIVPESEQNLEALGLDFTSEGT